MIFNGDAEVTEDRWVYSTCTNCDFEGESVLLDDYNALEQQNGRHSCDNKNLVDTFFTLYYGYCYGCDWVDDDAEMTYKEMHAIVTKHNHEKHNENVTKL